MAKPMPAPSYEIACQNSVVVEAEYLSYRPKELMGGIDYFTPPLARYQLKRVWHRGTSSAASTPSQYFLTRFVFDDGSACLAPSDWKFSTELLPQVKTTWILFLETVDQKTGVFTTYRGDFGRIEKGEESERIIRLCTEQPGS